jgi:uncharacterized membrane protein YgcG
MKIQGFHTTGLALAAAGVMALSTANLFAQTTAPAPGDTSSAGATTAGLEVTPAMSQVLQLAQAKISDSTIIAYVQNSGTVYGMNASQIVYLKQQGVSESVINAMLNQRTALAAAPQPPMPPENTAQYSTPDNTTVAQPTTPAPSTAYIVPDTQTYYYNSWAYPYYYPYYSWYYPVGIYWGWHGGYYGGYYGGWHGGYGGGWHGGGGFHSGGGGGGFHGGGGGFHR